MIDFTAIMSMTKINPTTELVLFWLRVTILGFIYIYGQKMYDLVLNILTPRSLKLIDKWQMYGHLITCGPGFKNDT